MESRCWRLRAHLETSPAASDKAAWVTSIGSRSSLALIVSFTTRSRCLDDPSFAAKVCPNSR